MKKYYFAYGSNLDINRLEARVGKVVNLGRHVLYGWKLIFNAGQDKSAFANIIFTGRGIDVVEGVVYALSMRQLKKLDDFEGAPKLYTRMIESFGGKDLQVYVSINPYYTQQAVKQIMPTKEYLNHIIKGATDNHLPTTLKQCMDMLPRATRGRALI